MGWIGSPISSVIAQTTDPFFEEGSLDSFDGSLDSFEEDAFTEDFDLNDVEIPEDEGSFDGATEEDFGAGKQDEDTYVDEDVLSDDTQQLLESALLQRRNFLSEEKANFAPNVLYGVGTGLMIGGWFALLTATTSRDTLRSIGLGIVLGGVMGAVIGGRSVINPNTPRPPAAVAPPPQGKLDYPLDKQGVTIALQWNF
ncbi:MAG: hypothetical protein HQM14_10510 [SAR324 cluster bacterium]|nr:hypothetical protein [SAR324 cluster bacterium]